VFDRNQLLSEGFAWSRGLATVLGYLSEAQVEALLQKQREQSPTLEAILMDLAALEDPPQWAPGGDGRREPPA